MEDKIFEIINTVLTNRNKETVSEIRPEMHLGEDIGLDSLDLAELTVRIEAEFDVDIFEEGIISTIEEVVEKLK